MDVNDGTVLTHYANLLWSVDLQRQMPSRFASK